MPRMKTKKKSKEKIQVILKKKDLALLQSITKSGTQNARVITRARILLLSQQGKTSAEIIAALECSPRSITDIRRRFVLRKRDAAEAIKDAPRSGQPKRILPAHEATLVATACTKAPEAHAHWTLEALKNTLLATHSELKSISYESIRQILLRNKLKPWREKNVVHT